MAFITYNEGSLHILQKYFLGGADFGPFYIGLGTTAAVLDPRATLADVVAKEVTGTGYARAEVDRGAAPTGWVVSGDIAESPVLTFTNTDPSEVWDPIDFVFLTLSATGTVGDDVLISACELADSVILSPGQSVDILFRFRQTTIRENSPTIMYGAASASVSADGEGTGTVA